MVQSRFTGPNTTAWLTGAIFVLGLAGCGSDSSGDSDNSNGLGGSPGTGGTGTGGTTAPGTGGTLSGTGGASPGTGGIVGNGGSGNTGGLPSTGGVFGGTGGVPPATGGTGGGEVTLVSCDLRTETSANPITAACGDVTTPTGTNIQLGTYGAIMDVNMGTGFENAVNAADMPGSATCDGFAALFGEDPALTAQLLDTGTLDFSLYTVYRPATWPAGPVPVISWGNGTCAQPEGYGALLRYVASYGYLVVAANSRWVGSGQEILHGLDYAAAANQDPASPYYQHLDMSKVGVMGHSQGSQGAAAAANDSRVQSVILFNGGSSAAKPFLAVSGDLDLGGVTAASMLNAINAAPKAAYLYYHDPAGVGAIRGHLVLMMQPERVTGPTANWWEMLLRNDANAQNWFVGTNCTLCNQADFEYGQHGL